MREREVEAYLVKQVKRFKGEIRKLKWVNHRGAPDRLVLLNGAWFVELKRPGKGLEEHQRREHEKMREQGARVFCLNSIPGVDRFIVKILGE